MWGLGGEGGRAARAGDSCSGSVPSCLCLATGAVRRAARGPQSRDLPVRSGSRPAGGAGGRAVAARDHSAGEPPGTPPTDYNQCVLPMQVARPARLLFAPGWCREGSVEFPSVGRPPSVDHSPSEQVALDRFHHVSITHCLCESLINTCGKKEGTNMHDYGWGGRASASTRTSALAPPKARPQSVQHGL